MEVGTQILIERMQTHPEEFDEGKISKWARHVSYAMEWMPEEDKQALREAINKRRIAQFNENVLRELAGEQDSEVEETLTIKTKGRYAMGWTDPRAVLNEHVAEHKKMYDHWTDAQKMFIPTDKGLEEWSRK